MHQKPDFVFIMLLIIFIRLAAATSGRCNESFMLFVMLLGIELVASGQFVHIIKKGKVKDITYFLGT
jgi:hypothetical protein